MRFNVDKKIKAVVESPVVGNVYNVRGGSGAKHGYMSVIVAIDNDVATVLTITKDGDIVSGSNYGLHYFEDKCPIAYCSCVEELTFYIGRIA